MPREPQSPQDCTWGLQHAELHSFDLSPQSYLFIENPYPLPLDLGLVVQCQTSRPVGQPLVLQGLKGGSDRGFKAAAVVPVNSPPVSTEPSMKSCSS